MRAAAVIYVGDLERMRVFYEACFGLTRVDGAADYCGLASEAWLLTLVQSVDAVPTADPAPRRSSTAIKPAFTVESIAALRPLLAAHGGQVDPADREWAFRDATHCDCVDPEGNVVQLIEAHAPEQGG